MFEKVIAVIKPQLPSIVRRVMTAGAALLASHGVLQSSQTAQFVELGTAIALAAIPEVWSWISNQLEQRKLVAAAKTGNPVAPPATKLETAVAMAIVKAAAPVPLPPPIPSVNLNGVDLSAPAQAIPAVTPGVPS